MERKIEIVDNPFAALFPSIAAAQEFSKQCESESNSKESVQNYIAQLIFCITLNKDNNQFCADKPTCLIFLSELNSEVKQSTLNSDTIGQAVFERLMLSNFPPNDIITSSNCNEDAKKLATTADVSYYLYSCFTRFKHYENKYQDEKDFLDLCKDTILENTVTALNDPSIFYDPSIHDNLIKLVKKKEPLIFDYLDAVSSHVYHTKQISDVCTAFYFLFKEFDLMLVKLPFGCPESADHISLLHSVASKSALIAEALVSYSTPHANANGVAYQQTLLGMLLNPSCLPARTGFPYPYFDSPSRASSQEHQITQTNIGEMLSQRNEILYEVFYVCLKASANSRNRLLNWFGDCVKANLGRTRISNRELVFPGVGIHFVSDGFMLNFTSVFLRLCKPFVTKEKVTLLLNIDPSYIREASKVGGPSDERGIHVQVPKDETCLIPYVGSSDEIENSSKTYSFTTECFFMTHLCLYAGFSVVHSKLLKISHSLSQQQHLYEDVLAQVGGDRGATLENIHSTMDRGMTQFLSLKAALLVPDNLDMTMNFLNATSVYLVNKAFGNDSSNTLDNLKFPLPEVNSRNLMHIPEYLIENVSDFVIFLRRFNPHVLETHGPSLEQLMTLILAFMGNSNAVKNPHLRAKLAEMLECLMPHDEEEIKINPLVANYHRNNVFRSHPHIKHLMRTLLDVFVSIEMTGQSVEFEQKFNYRRPMYIVLKFIWKVKLHRDSLKSLAEEAEEGIESVQPPLFLRFINLLINDAIFLLDEALSYMSQLREHQQRQDEQEHSNLSHEQRSRNEQNFHHMGMLARFHNVMSNETIHTLMLITQNIKSIFMHSIMVDRVAAMLNYFLVHLVGPKKKQFKVKNLKDYDFKPQQIVSDISQIYLNLEHTESELNPFCSAVAADSRSYTPFLFHQTISVLKKIGKSNLVVAFEEFSVKIKNIYEGNQKIEEALSDAPDEFLDPIMNTLMADPVFLPTSNMIVDRSTISRHLLSDQTDPFNRSPLNMEMVKTDEILRSKIQDWISSRKDS